jgi:hypothetical protein
MQIKTPMLKDFRCHEGGTSVDARTGQSGKPIPQVGDTDEVWYDPGTNSYYVAHTSKGATEFGSAKCGAVSLVDAFSETFVGDIPPEGAGSTPLRSMQRISTSSFRLMARQSLSSPRAGDANDRGRTTVQTSLCLSC